MSAQTALPAPEAAFDTIFQQVHAPAFFNKLAGYGIAPQTHAEAQELLELAGKLRIVSQEPTVKAAAANAANANRFGVANQALDRTLAAHGLDGGIKAASAGEQAIAVHQASAQLAQSPAIYNAVLALKAAEAQQLAAA